MSDSLGAHGRAPLSVSPKANLLAAIRHTGPHHVPYAGEGAYRLVDHRGRKPPRQGEDAWGVRWAPLPESYVVGPGEPAASFPVAHPVAEIEQVLARDFPDGGAPELFTGILDGLDREQVLTIGRHSLGPLERLMALLGPTQALLALARHPDAGRAALDRIAGYHIRVAGGYLAAGVAAGWLADDFAGQGGFTIAPAMWRRLILPGLARIVAVYRAAGAPVFYHTCGRVDEVVGDLLDAGVAVLNLQSSACDLAALKARYGSRIAFIGGVDSAVMQRGTPEDVRRAVEYAISTLGAGGGLILAPDQALAFPPANEAAFVEAAHASGIYPAEGS